MKMKALVLVTGSLAVAIGCGRGSGNGEGAAAASGAAAGGAMSAGSSAAASGAAAGGAGSGAGSAGGSAGGAGKLATCSDGDLFAGARISASDARFCVGSDGKISSCWRVETGTGAISAVADLGAAGAAGVVDVPPPDLSPPSAAPKPAPAAAGRTGWSATVEDGGVTVCGPAGCSPFALQPPVNPEDDRTAAIAVAISASGSRLAVSRGDETLTPVTLEVYDRPAGKKLGSVRPRTQCALVRDFLGETAMFTEWRCTDDGDNHLLVSPAGKLAARVEGSYPHHSVSLQVDGDRWAFPSYETIALYDIARGKRLAMLPNPEAEIAAAHQRLYVFDSRRVELTVYASDGKQLVKSRAPTCRYEWEAEALGPLALEMPTAAVTKAIGAPRRKTKPDPMNLFASTWTYGDGVTLSIEATNADPNSDGPILPFRVVGIVATAPSALRTRAGIGVGSTFEEVMGAYGPHIVRTRSDADRFFVGNDASNDPDGLIFWTTGGKVSKILLGRADWMD